MTRLDKDLVREVRADDGARDVSLTVRITPHGIFTRLKGSRHELGPVSWGTIHLRAAQVTAGVPASTSQPTRRRRGQR